MPLFFYVVNNYLALSRWNAIVYLLLYNYIDLLVYNYNYYYKMLEYCKNAWSTAEYVRLAFANCTYEYMRLSNNGYLTYLPVNT